MEELARVSTNPDEINLGESDEDEEEGGVVEEVPIGGMETQAIPSAVFGSISEEVQGKVLGAKERFAQQKKKWTKYCYTMIIIATTIGL